MTPSSVTTGRENLRAGGSPPSATFGEDDFGLAVLPAEVPSVRVPSDEANGRRIDTAWMLRNLRMLARGNAEAQKEHAAKRRIVAIVLMCLLFLWLWKRALTSMRTPCGHLGVNTNPFRPAGWRFWPHAVPPHASRIDAATIPHEQPEGTRTKTNWTHQPIVGLPG